MSSNVTPYTSAWYRTMERINPLLTGLIRQRSRRGCSHDHCAVCGTEGAESHELLMQGHLINLYSCQGCYALYGATYRANMLAAAMLPPAGKSRKSA